MSPGQVDRALVRRHLLALDAALVTLERLRGAAPADLRLDLEKLWAIERGLQLCCQNVIDIATHLAAASGVDVPDYTTAIDRLAALEILPHEFASRFRGIAGLRNVLVHGYLEVDLALVRSLLDSRLDDFRELASHVDAHVASLAPGV